MSKFTDEIGIAIREVMQDPIFLARVMFKTSGRMYWVKKSSDADYPRFVAEHPNYDDGVAAVYTTIQAGVTAAGSKDAVLVSAPDMAAGAIDPTSYAETIIIAEGKSNLSIIGVLSNRTQGGLPQIKIGAGATAMLTIRSPGCLIQNLGFNGAGSTGGGILLDDDASTKSAFGVAIENCHFKNCQGSGAAVTGGAIMWAIGGAWQVYIKGCEFFRNRASIVLKGTTTSVPVDIVIEDCIFGTNDTSLIDVDIYLAGGSGVDGLLIRNCDFATVDVPAYAGSGYTARYLYLVGCINGMLVNCNFACTGKTFGDGTVNAAKIPATVRMVRCYQEDAIITRTS